MPCWKQRNFSSPNPPIWLQEVSTEPPLLGKNKPLTKYLPRRSRAGTVDIDGCQKPHQSNEINMRGPSSSSLHCLSVEPDFPRSMCLIPWSSRMGHHRQRLTYLICASMCSANLVYGLCLLPHQGTTSFEVDLCAYVSGAGLGLAISIGSYGLRN